MKLIKNSNLTRLFAIGALVLVSTSVVHAQERSDGFNDEEYTEIGGDKGDSAGAKDDDGVEGVKTEPPEWICQIIDCGDGGGPIPKLIAILF